MATAAWAKPTKKASPVKTQAPSAKSLWSNLPKANTATQTIPNVSQAPQPSTPTFNSMQSSPAQSSQSPIDPSLLYKTSGGGYQWDPGSSTFKWIRSDGTPSGATRQAPTSYTSGTSGTAQTPSQLQSSIEAATAGLSMPSKNASAIESLSSSQTANREDVSKSKAPTYAPGTKVANTASGIMGSIGNALSGYKTKLDEMLAAADASRAANIQAIKDMQASDKADLETNYTQKQAALKADLARRGILDSSTTGQWLTDAMQDHDRKMQTVVSNATAKLAELVSQGAMDRSEAEMKYYQLLNDVEQQNRNYQLQVQRMAQDEQLARDKMAADRETNALEQAKIDRMNVQNRVDYAKSLGFVDPTEFGGTGERSAISVRRGQDLATKQQLYVDPLTGTPTNTPNILGNRTISMTNATNAKTAGGAGGGGRGINSNANYSTASGGTGYVPYAPNFASSDRGLFGGLQDWATMGLTGLKPTTSLSPAAEKQLQELKKKKNTNISSATETTTSGSKTKPAWMT